MKVTNIQLKILLPLVIKEAKENPNKELDFLLDTMMTACYTRGLDELVEGIERPKLGVVRWGHNKQVRVGDGLNPDQNVRPIRRVLP